MRHRWRDAPDIKRRCGPMMSDVSNRHLWDFLHGVCPDTPVPEVPGDDGEDNDEAAVESESEISDGSFSQVTKYAAG